MVDLSISESDRDLAVLLAGFFRFFPGNRRELSEYDREMIAEASELLARIGRPGMPPPWDRPEAGSKLISDPKTFLQACDEARGGPIVAGPDYRRSTKPGPGRDG